MPCRVLPCLAPVALGFGGELVIEVMLMADCREDGNAECKFVSGNVRLRVPD